MIGYAARDLLRNPVRTLAAVSGVALAVALVAATALFVDASAARMTQRAIAPVAIDMQALLSTPLASPVQLAESVGGGPALAAGQTTTVTLRVVNGSSRALTNVVVKDAVAQPLAYVAGSTTVDGRTLGDSGNETPLTNGVTVPRLAGGATAVITYRVQATAAVASVQTLTMHASVTSTEAPSAVIANSAPAMTLENLASLVSRVSGIQSADPLGGLDLAPGSLRTTTAVVGQTVRLIAFNPDYLQHYQLVNLTTGTYTPDTVLLSTDAASTLSAAAGQTVTLAVPGLSAPITLRVGGVADFSHADALFVSRSPDLQGELAPVPNVVVVPIAVFENTILPALRVDAASAAPQLKSPPYLELDLHVDRARLNSDPTVAVVATQGLKRSVERVAPGQVNVTDNLSETLTAARADTILAKVLFLFLGLPGVLLAAYLSRYAGGLLAESQRRERAVLRARGSQPRQLLTALTVTTVAVALIGSVLGLAIGVAAVALILGPDALKTAAVNSLVVSAAAAIAAGLLTTGLALYLPGRRALYREANEERRELPSATTPLWLRMRIDVVLIITAAAVWFITIVAGGFKPTTAEGQSVSLSLYTLLAPLLAWLGATLFAVRLLLLAGRHLPGGRAGEFKGAASGVLRRSVQRRSLPLASAVIAVGLAVGFGSNLALVVATYDAEKSADARFVVGSDVRVTPSAAVPQQSTFADRLMVSGVQAVTPLAQTSGAIVGTERRALVAIDATTFMRVATLNDSFFSGITAQGAMTRLQADPASVLISTEMARTFNVQVGDQVQVQLPRPGGKPVPVTFHAAGLFVNFPGYPQGIDLVGNLSFYRTVVGSQTDVFLVKTSDPSADSVSRVALDIKSHLGTGSPVLIDTTATAVNRDASSLTAINMRGLGSLESVFAVVMSAVGVSIFVFGLLLQRRKEFVTMRALGMGLAQVRALVLGEAAIVAVLSLVVGALVGAGTAQMFVQILAPLFTIAPAALTVPTGELGLLAILVLAGVGLSSIVSARYLRRLNPAELLREE